MSNDEGPPHKLSTTDQKYRDMMEALGIARKVARKGYELAYSQNWPNESTDWDKELAKIDAVTQVTTKDNKDLLVAYLIW